MIRKGQDRSLSVVIFTSFLSGLGIAYGFAWPPFWVLPSQERLEHRQDLDAVCNQVSQFGQILLATSCMILVSGVLK